MLKIPAIDIKAGKCIRLKQGKLNDVTTYANNPFEVALKWQLQGAKYLHIVDIDSAFNGRSDNLEYIKDIVNTLNIPVQVGGGLRDKVRVEALLEQGVSRCILGTMVFKKPDEAETLIKRYGDKIAVSLDCQGDEVQIDGWTKNSGKKLEQTIDDLVKMGLQTLIYTDISRDGMLCGPNFEVLKRIVKRDDIKLIASGGISSQSDLDQLASLQLYGAIIGKALYEGKIKL